jgi:hypothetical protein
MSYRIELCNRQLKLGVSDKIFYDSFGKAFSL